VSIFRRTTRSESRVAQRAAGVLFLPLAFNAKREVVSTASPSKMPEYLAAERPILVHAPPFSYVVRYAREHQFAEVVDAADEDAIAHAIEPSRGTVVAAPSSSLRHARRWSSTAPRASPKPFASHFDQ
jgi:hypothetical protein